MAKKETKTQEKTPVKFAVGTHGRTFEGVVTKKFPQRAVIEFEREVYVPKFERYYKKKTRLHAKIPAGLSVEVGDFIKIRECRPLSKIIHFMVVEIIRKAEEKQ